MPMIEIWDGPDVRLCDLLDQVPALHELDWSIMEIWAVARDDDTDVVALEREAAASPVGLALSGERLRDLACRLSQVVDGIIAGYEGTPPVRSDADLCVSAEVVIETVDSTFWRIYARNTAVIDRMRRRYEDVRDIVPEMALPPVHEKS